MGALITFLLAALLPIGQGGTSATNQAMKISAERTDFDRNEGVVMFAGGVFVEYDDYDMASDKMFVFLNGTNELSSIVAVGNVAVTNGNRVGLCATAKYFHKSGEMEMYGTKDSPAKLLDGGKDGNAVEGSKIKFWLDSEQVEVENSRITVGNKEGVKIYE